MFDKIKDLMKIKESIDEINSKLNSTTTELDELKKEIKNLAEESAKLKNNQQEFFLSFKENIDLIKTIREDLEKEAYNFKLLQNHLQARILDKFESEIRENLMKPIEKLKMDAEAFRILKDKVAEIAIYSEELSKEIAKLMLISKNIKKEDFELTKFADKIFEADNEKLRLMKDVDSLQRLIAKMRREQRK
jgi:uncharacterized phage infection (PIP) family protein YhgE